MEWSRPRGKRPGEQRRGPIRPHPTEQSHEGVEGKLLVEQQGYQSKYEIRVENRGGRWCLFGCGVDFQIADGQPLELAKGMRVKAVKHTIGDIIQPGGKAAND